MDDDDDEEHGPGTGATSKKKLKKKKPKHWRSSERSRIKTGLLSFGYGRWYRIWKQGNLDKRWTLEETKAYGEAFVRKMCQARDADIAELLPRIEIVDLGPKDFIPTTTTLTESTSTTGEAAAAAATDSSATPASTDAMLVVEPTTTDASTNGVVPPTTDAPTTDAPTTDALSSTEPTSDAVPPPSEPSTTEPPPSFDDDPSLTDTRFIEYLGRNYSQMVTRFELLARVSMRVQQALASDTPIVTPKVPPPTKWWTEEEDRSLLLGFYRLGFGRYREMRMRPELSFLRYRKSSAESTAAATTSSTDGAVETPAKDDADKMAITSVPAVEQADATPAESVPVEIADDDDDDDDDDNENENENESEATTEADADWPDWPSAKLLARRVRRLVRDLETQRSKTQERLEQQERRRDERRRLRDEKEEERRKRREQLAAEWSKREKLDFYRAIVSYGVPRIRDRHLHAVLDSLLPPKQPSADPEAPATSESDAVAVADADADKTKQTIDAEKQNLDNDWEFFIAKAKLGRKSPELIQEYFQQFFERCQRLANAKAKAKAEGVADEEAAAAIKADSDEVLLSSQQSKRVLQRIEALTALRDQVIWSPNANEIFGRLSAQAQLPSWWKHRKHDIAVLKGIHSHGFGQWDAICSDPKLPFWKRVQKVIAASGGIPPPAPASTTATSTTAESSTTTSDSTTTEAMAVEEVAAQVQSVMQQATKELSSAKRETSSATRDTSSATRDDDADDDIEPEGDGDLDGDDEIEGEGDADLAELTADGVAQPVRARGRGGRSKSTRYANMIDFPKERPLVKRIEYLIKTAASIAAKLAGEAEPGVIKKRRGRKPRKDNGEATPTGGAELTFVVDDNNNNNGTNEEAGALAMLKWKEGATPKQRKSKTTKSTSSSSTNGLPLLAEDEASTATQGEPKKRRRRKRTEDEGPTASNLSPMALITAAASATAAPKEFKPRKERKPKRVEGNVASSPSLGAGKAATATTKGPKRKERKPTTLAPMVVPDDDIIDDDVYPQRPAMRTTAPQQQQPPLLPPLMQVLDGSHPPLLGGGGGDGGSPSSVAPSSGLLANMMSSNLYTLPPLPMLSQLQPPEMLLGILQRHIQHHNQQQQQQQPKITSLFERQRKQQQQQEQEHVHRHSHPLPTSTSFPILPPIREGNLLPPISALLNNGGGGGGGSSGGTGGGASPAAGGRRGFIHIDETKRFIEEVDGDEDDDELDDDGASGGSGTPTSGKRARRPRNSKVKTYVPYAQHSDGSPVLPLQLGTTCLVSLGTIVHDREGFHNKNYIWPAGFQTSRKFKSFVHPHKKTTYFSEIVDNGSAHPYFRVTADDARDQPFTGHSPSNVWVKILEAVQQVTGSTEARKISVSGPEYFGLANGTISKVLFASHSYSYLFSVRQARLTSHDVVWWDMNFYN